MLRKQIRERREYIYRKHKEEAESKIRDRKERLKRALDENKPIPTELREDALKLQEALEYDDEGATHFSSVDDEYKYGGVEDPKLMVTTARDPSVKLKIFAKEMKLILPNSKRINRGNLEIAGLIAECRKNNFTDLIILTENRGKPDGMRVCHLPYGPTAYFNLSQVVLRHDIPGVEKMSEAFPHLIFNNFSTKLGQRCTNILKYLFPVPKEDSKRILTFSNSDDNVSFRHHTYSKDENGQIELKEVGPRMEMKLYKIIQGTLEKEDTANVEWRMHPYTNTAKKRRFLFMSFVIEIKFRSEDEVGHHLFIRKHQTRVIDTSRPKNRTILVCNIPPWCPTNQIKRLFSPYGSIVSTEFQLKPGKGEEIDDLEQKELEEKFKVAYIVFAKEQSIANLKTASENGDKMIVSTIENPVISGLESFCARYNQSFPNIKKLQNEITKWMSDFEEKNNEDETDVAEEGWTAVKGKGTTRRTEEEQNEMKMKAAKKRKKGQLLNFYQFQIRESKKQKIVELREKFEADKKKVERMKQDRKFKPMTA